MDPNETADIRRALDRLQQAFELLNDRYRDMRRERKQLRERIEELLREREVADTANAAQSEMAAADRRRAVEMEERAVQAERRAEELVGRVDDLERVVAERESLVAEQVDMLQALRSDLERQRQAGEESWTLGEGLREEVDMLRRQLAQAQAEAERYREEVANAAMIGEGQVAISGSELEKLRSETAALRQTVAMQQQERYDMEGKHHQAIGKLDAATRAEAMARTEVVALQDENARLERSIVEMKESYAELEHAIGAGDESGRALIESHAAQSEAHDREMRDLHERMKQRDHEHAVAIAAINERISAADLERERLERQVRELRSERDSARAIADRLREQLNQADVSDDERLIAQRVQIDNLMRDLSEALDMAARKEAELAEAGHEQERLQANIARLGEELEQLKLHPVENGTVAALDDDERRQLGEKIDQAIRLIDRHLEKGA
jgi:chromosome segregation ATPase